MSPLVEREKIEHAPLDARRGYIDGGMGLPCPADAPVEYAAAHAEARSPSDLGRLFSDFALIFSGERMASGNAAGGAE